MQYIPWNGDMAEFPEPLRRYLRPGHVFDSSSSAEATVYYSDIGQGCYIKKARHGALRNEAAMTRYFHDKGLAAAVLHYGQTMTAMTGWRRHVCQVTTAPRLFT